ncbi:3-methyladenine DNA glycosylase [Brachybacterium sp. NBEC-018]|nr:3-methyladenine DNA glycosylase [Brachybacterium sp. NBEC-018]
MAHTITGLDHLDPSHGAQTRLLTGPAGPVPVTLTPRADGIALRTPAEDPAVLADLQAQVRRWFDLDADLAPIDAHLSRSPVLAAQVSARPGLRITRYPDRFEAVVLIVLGQQVSLAAGRLFGARLLAAHGEGTAATPVGPLRRFPRPAVLARVDPDRLRDELGLTRSRTRTVLATAALFADLPDRAPTSEELAAVPGIGPWTLACAAIRAGTDPDAFPASDAVLRRAMVAAGAGEDPAVVESWRPWRSYAAVRLWAGSGAHPA